MSREGGKPERICDGDQAEWSPDGRAIVLRRNEQLFTRELAGGQGETHQPERLAALLGSRVEPGWAVDRLCLPLGRRQRRVSRSRRGRRAEDRVR